MLYVTIRAGDHYYEVRLTPTQARRHDNGMLVSIGLTVGRDLRMSTLRRWLGQRIARPITREEWNR